MDLAWTLCGISMYNKRMDDYVCNQGNRELMKGGNFWISFFFYIFLICVYFMQNEVELTAVAPAEPVQTEAQPVETTPEMVEQPAQIQPVEGVTEAPIAVPSKEWTNVESFAEASFMSSVINIINTVIGAGILSIAFSIMRAGVFGSSLLILVILLPSLLTSYYLSVATVYTGEAIYGDVGTKLCNKFVGISTNITQVLLDFGIDIAYMMVLFNQIVDIARELFGVELSEYKTVGTIQSIFFYTSSLSS